MIANSHLYSCEVTHTRFGEKKHSFKNKFFWFGLDHLDIKSKSIELGIFLGVDKTSIYRYSDSDHFDFNKGSLKENIQHFIYKNGSTEEVSNFKIYTNLSFLGYLFNPIGLILIELKSGLTCAIIEIGNTFNEIKPYFVSPDCFEEQNFTYTTQKLFYISPFIDHRNYMTFKFKKEQGGFNLIVEDFQKLDNGKKSPTLTTTLQTKEKSFEGRNLLKLTLKNPFNTLYVIFFIHYHAAILYLKKFKYYKKTELAEYQKGALKWKK